ncbi:hypothetical protein [Phenylobacterium sp.]|uniref:hypothetical protein n=1 Tax=Phenylobacterium sp. TaxID=1871053 RepID=UPI0027318F44|nr:hypothetical protein [Phenylobacterium sp.]MDP2212603.1 hypothetical protein [Phenylobacterium sp.]
MSESKPAAQADLSRQALKMKEAVAPAHPAPGQTAGEGMEPNPNGGIAPSGALDAEGHRPVLERSRKSR